MEDFQESNSQPKKTMLPIKTIEQLVASYLVADIIENLIRKEEKNTKNKLKKIVPRLDPIVTNKRALILYEEFVNIVKYKPIFVYIAKYALEDMARYNFKDDPSVVTILQSDVDHLKQKFSVEYSVLAKINLEEHTLNVFEQAIREVKKRGRISGLEIMILAALLHDFGKSSKIRKELLGEVSKRQYRAHADVSHMYINSILARKIIKTFNLQTMPDTLKMIAFIVQNHHPNSKELKSNHSIDFVVQADFHAREFEYNKIKFHSEE